MPNSGFSAIKDGGYGNNNKKMLVAGCK